LYYHCSPGNINAILLVLLTKTITIAQDHQEDWLLFSIYFGGGSYAVDKLQQQELFDFIGSIKNIDRYDTSVHAHTDNIGD
jgi:outer membrane protein OmpA-like peptidoglycan-associated protein